MQEIFERYQKQIEKIRAESGANGNSSPVVSGLHRATLLGLNQTFNLENQLNLLSDDETAKLYELVDQVDEEIDSRFR